MLGWFLSPNGNRLCWSSSTWSASRAAAVRLGRPSTASFGTMAATARPGMTVEVDTDYEPDAVVNCGPPIPDDAIAAPNPVIVVEVLSP